MKYCYEWFKTGTLFTNKRAFTVFLDVLDYFSNDAVRVSEGTIFTVLTVKNFQQEYFTFLKLNCLIVSSTYSGLGSIEFIDDAEFMDTEIKIIQNPLS